MRLLSECPVEGQGHVRRRREYWLVDRKNDTDNHRDPLTLIITSDQHDFVVYALDRAEIEWDGKRPDGVLVADLGSISLVCFIELKSTMKGDLAVFNRAIEQLLSGVGHFCPAGRVTGPPTHGDEHHDRWRDGDDLLPLLLNKSHRVFGIVVALKRAPPRTLPKVVTRAGKEVELLLTEIPPKGFNRAEIRLEDLVTRKLGIVL